MRKNKSLERQTNKRLLDRNVERTEGKGAFQIEGPIEVSLYTCQFYGLVTISTVISDIATNTGLD